MSLLAVVRAAEPAAQATAPAAPTVSDEKIVEVLKAVSRHQLHPLKAGDDRPVDSVAAAKAVAAPEGVTWNYPWGVTLYGVLRSTEVTRDAEMRNFVLEHNQLAARDYAWLAGVREKFADDPALKDFLGDRNRIKIRGLVQLGSLDSCGAMGVQLLEGMLRFPAQVTPEEKVVAARIADWIAHKQDRLPDGTLWRPKSKDENGAWPPGTIWADDLYMGCPFLVRWSKFTGDGQYLTDAAQQVLNMASRLQDTDGLWFHAYCEPKREHSPFKWGRANGWILVATAEILSELPEKHPLREKLLDVYRRHAAGVIKVQAPSGMWRQVLDHEELWEETSCTAMFAYAIARGVNRGWLPAEDMAVARKAFAGLTNYITPEGVVKGTCQGTNIGFKLEYYADRQRPDDDLHGRGVVLLAGTEILSAKK